MSTPQRIPSAQPERDTLRCHQPETLTLLLVPETGASQHDLRHTWATLTLRVGVHPKVVQERLGHPNISIAMDTYSHVLPDMQESAAEMVAALVDLSNAGDEG